MSSLNKALLIGHIGKIGEVRYTKDTKPFLTVDVATSERFKGNEKTEWHKVVLFDKQAEFVTKYLDKGSLVFVEGRIQTRKYTDKNGRDVYATEIVANTVNALGKKGTSTPPFAKEQKPEEPYSGFDGDIDDIPF